MQFLCKAQRRTPITTRADGESLASIGEVCLFAVLVVTVGASRSHDVGGIDDLVLILRLGGFVDRHSGLTQPLNELRPVGILQRNRTSVRASSSRNQKQPCGLRQSPRTVLNR